MIVFWMNHTCASTCNTSASHNCHSSTWLQLPPNPGHIKKNKSKPMMKGTIRFISQALPTLKITYPLKMGAPWKFGDSELGNPSIFRGENAVSFQGVYRKKTKKKGGTSKNQNLPAIGPNFASLRSKQYKWKFGAVTWASRKQTKKTMG